jgi:restriction system protein
MPIPDYQRIMFPLLKLSSDGFEHSSKESVEKLSKIFNLTEKEIEEKYDTKNVTKFYDRVHCGSILSKECRLD